MLFKAILDKDADMIIVSRMQYKSKDVIYRRIGKWLIRNITKILISNKIYDINSGLKVYNIKLEKNIVIHVQIL